jgi:hypothetical protein
MQSKQVQNEREPVAWRVLVNDNGRTMHVYTEALPYMPDMDSGIRIRSEPVPLYAYPAPDLQKLADDLGEALHKIAIGEDIAWDHKPVDQMQNIAEAALRAAGIPIRREE